MMARSVRGLILLAACMVVVSACAAPDLTLNAQCESLLRQAETQLEDARTRGFASAVEMTKATGLITAARVQQQFNKYPNCIDKAKRAITYIKMSQQ